MTDTKKTEVKTYPLRILKLDLWEKIEQEAQRSYRSANEQINFILDRYFSNKDTGK